METLLLISTKTGSKEEVISKLIEIPGIINAYTVFGAFDIVAMARVNDVRIFEFHLKKQIPEIELINALISDSKENVILKPKLMGGVI